MKWPVVFLRIFFLVLATRPIPVQGEFVFSVAGWTTVGGSSAHIEGTRNLYNAPYLLEGSEDGSPQSLGLDFGVTWWFARAPMLGIGLDIFPSSVTFGSSHMSLTALTSCVLLRFPLGKSREFRYGRLFPYLGLGFGSTVLDGQATLFPETDANYRLDSSGLMAKVGLEAIIVGGLSVFIEARYLTSNFTSDTVDKTYWDYVVYDWIFIVPYVIGRDETHLSASFSSAQISIGLALHLGK